MEDIVIKTRMEQAALSDPVKADRIENKIGCGHDMNINIHQTDAVKNMNLDIGDDQKAIT